jgi:hypothetical protein
MRTSSSATTRIKTHNAIGASGIRLSVAQANLHTKPHSKDDVMKKRKANVSTDHGGIENASDEGKVFIKALLQRALEAQVEQANLDIKEIKALVAQVEKASRYLINKLAEEANFDHDSKVAVRIEQTGMTGFESLDAFLLFQILEARQPRRRRGDGDSL